jgi:Ca2+:H+ antiporter
VKATRFLYVLFLAVPLALVAWLLNRSGAYAGQLTMLIFGLALAAIIPLAGVIGRLTDTLQKYYGDTLGGLLGASFGNVPELAIGLALIVHAQMHAANSATVTLDFEVIRGLLIGSVINNILFVLGSSVFLAALRNGRMNFSADNAAGFASMLALAVVGLALPTIATNLAQSNPETAKIPVTIAFGVILILCYVAFVAATQFNVGNNRGKRAKREEHGEQAGAAVTVDGAVVLAEPGEDDAERAAEAKAEAARAAAEEKEREMRRTLRRGQPYAAPLALVGLGAATLATVVIAIILVSVTDNVIHNTVLTPLSVGLVLFPIVCNLGEQAGAVVNAWHNRMEGALSVAAGSSVQVALFVTPVLALASIAIALATGTMGNPQLVLTIIFPALELIVLGLVTFVFALVSLDGETTWLEGLQLLAFYAMVVAVAFFLPGR